VIKLGIVGCGNVAEKRHLPALQTIKGIEVAAVADVNSIRLDSIASRFQIPKRYPDYHALLDDSDLTAVAICAPVSFHADIALAAFDAGKHIFMEKPLALALDEADRLIERDKSARSRVMVGFNLRWHRLVCETRTILQSGILGPIEAALFISTTGTRHSPQAPDWMQRRSLGGGVISEYAGHSFDLWRFLLEDEVRQVYAESRSDEWDDVTAIITTRMGSGVSASTILCESSSTNKELQIYGHAGYLHASLYRIDGLKFYPRPSFPGDLRTRLRNFVHSVKCLPKAMRSWRTGGEYHASFVAEWQHFADCIEQNKLPQCSLDDGRKSLQAVLAAVESACTGRAIEINQGD